MPHLQNTAPEINEKVAAFIQDKLGICMTTDLQPQQLVVCKPNHQYF